MLSTLQLPATAVRVERHTDPELNQAIRAVTDARLAEFERADATRMAKRLVELEGEWDIERTLQLNAVVIAGTGLMLGAIVDRRFLLLPLAVFSFFLQHALQGWCPPIPSSEPADYAPSSDPVALPASLPVEADPTP